MSYLEIPVQIDEQAIALVLEEQLPVELFHVRDLGIPGVEVTVRRADLPRLGFAGKTLRSTLPLQIEIRGPWSVRVEAGMELDLSSELMMDAEGSLHTESRLIDHRWLSEPEIRLGGLRVPLRRLTDALLDRADRQIVSRLDRELMQRWAVARPLHQMWMELSTARPIPGPTPLSLRLNPKAWRASPPVKEPGGYRTGISLELDPVVYGGLYPVVTPAQEVPQLERLEAVKPELDLDVKFVLSEDFLLKALRSQLEGHRLDWKGREVTVSHVGLAVGGGYLWVDLGIEGDLRAEVRLQARPMVDPVSALPRLTDVSLTIEPDSPVLGILARTFSAPLRNMLLSRIHSGIAGGMAETVRRLNEELEGKEVVEGVVLSGEIDGFSFADLEVGEARLEGRVQVLGGVRLRVLQIPLPPPAQTP